MNATRLAGALLLVVAMPSPPAAFSLPQEQKVVEFQITPEVQTELDRWKKVAAEWVADKEIVAAVQKANVAGPIEGMTEKAWKELKPGARRVLELKMNPTAQRLIAHMSASGGAVSEIFLNGDQGHKIAFADKTSSYIHLGKSKFDVPVQTLKPWQGKPEADKSAYTYQVQISVPVLEPLREGQDPTERKAIGVLVVGINLTHLEAIAHGK